MTVYWTQFLNIIILLRFVLSDVLSFSISWPNHYQLHHLCIGQVALMKYTYLRLYDKENENDWNNYFAKFIAMCLLSFTFMFRPYGYIRQYAYGPDRMGK